MRKLHAKNLSGTKEMGKIDERIKRYKLLIINHKIH